MRVLVVQNYDDVGLGLLGQALDEAGAELDIRNAHRGEILPKTADDHDAIVVLGGGQNARDDENYPYIPALLDLMRDFAERDRALLGVCLGSQLLARAYGGDNLIGAAPEFGWRTVCLTEAAATDPVLAAASENFSVFQWHDDTFTLPEGATRLAGNDVANNQAFRIGRAAYGIQFHFEADRALVRQWTADFADYLAERQPGWPERLDGEAALHGGQADATGLALARAWVAAI